MNERRHIALSFELMNLWHNTTRVIKKILILKFNEFMIYGGETSSLWYCSIDTL